MIGGLKTTSSRLAMVAAGGLLMGGLSLTPAAAADLGGDCCADLEERVSELEATSVRHANRKVTLTLSGQVNSAVMFWDNGEESDIYVIDNDESSSRIRLVGKGNISPGVSAGFTIEFDVLGAGSTQNDGDDPTNGFLQGPRKAEWFVKSDTLGTLTVGQGSMASDGAFEVSFSDGWYASVGYGLSTTNMGSFTVYNDIAQAYTNFTWFAIGSDFDNSRRNRVRYDTPTMAGFTLSASWGEDDEADVALRYANEFNGVRVAAAAAYAWDDEDGNGDQSYSEEYGGSLALFHTPSGVHIQGGYSLRDRCTDDDPAAGGQGGICFDQNHAWIAAGVSFRANTLGSSDVSIQYIENTDSIINAGVNDIDYTSYGISFTQQIDAIGGTAYLSYNRHEADDSLATLSSEFDQVTAGMRIRY